VAFPPDVPATGPLITWRGFDLAGILVRIGKVFAQIAEIFMAIGRMLLSFAPWIALAIVTIGIIAAETTTHQLSIAIDFNGGASNGGQTVVVNGDGTGADIGGLFIGSQATQAENAAWDCDIARLVHSKANPKLKGNFNTGIGFTWLDGMPQAPVGPAFGVLGPDTHSEPQLVAEWEVLLPILGVVPGTKPGSHFSLLMFTRNIMCDVCRSRIPLWNQRLAAVAGPGVTVHLYAWESIDPRNDVGSNNIQQVPLP
jgi:hypothetical protein